MQLLQFSLFTPDGKIKLAASAKVHQKTNYEKWLPFHVMPNTASNTKQVSFSLVNFLLLKMFIHVHTLYTF